jgi:hypothetical protein
MDSGQLSYLRMQYQADGLYSHFYCSNEHITNTIKYYTLRIGGYCSLKL